jgi:hypothetical protein
MEFRYRLNAQTSGKQNSTTKLQLTTEETADATVSRESNQSLTDNHFETPSMPSRSKAANWAKDRYNIALLLFLYLLQGVPLGMAGSIPLIIQSIGVSWSQQATFSFAFWPFSLKLLWAPIVDSLYLKRFGRRKSWLIPTQYLISVVMIILSYYINDILLTTKTTTTSRPRRLHCESFDILVYVRSSM